MWRSKGERQRHRRGERPLSCGAPAASRRASRASRTSRSSRSRPSRSIVSASSAKRRLAPPCGCARTRRTGTMRGLLAQPLRRTIDSAASSRKASSNCASDWRIRMLRGRLPVGFGRRWCASGLGARRGVSLPRPRRPSRSAGSCRRSAGRRPRARGWPVEETLERVPPDPPADREARVALHGRALGAASGRPCRRWRRGRARRRSRRRGRRAGRRAIARSPPGCRRPRSSRCPARRRCPGARRSSRRISSGRSSAS